MTGDLFTSPHSSGSIVAASGWVEQLLRGELATAIAVVAIAIVGLGMLSGRISARGALRVVLGCFILFGSPAIARGLLETARDTGETSPPTTAPIHVPPVVLPSAPADTSANPFDPYSSNPPPS